MIYKVSYPPEPYSHSKNKTKVELDFSDYATKPDLKGLAGVHTSQFTKDVNLAKLKSDIDESALNKLKTVPSALI